MLFAAHVLCPSLAFSGPSPPRLAGAVSSRTDAPRMDAFAWNEDEKNELNLLPFGLDEVLLPGETKQVHLFEARFLEVCVDPPNASPKLSRRSRHASLASRHRQLFTDAESRHQSCVGQLLVTPNGNVAAVTSLLEIEESRRQEVGVWARLRCVGRVRLLEIEQTDFQFARARVELVTDTAEDAVAPSDLDECLAAHSECVRMETKLGRNSGKDEGGISERVEWGHEVVGELGFGVGLAKERDRRREMLCFRGLDAPPAPALDGSLQRLWGADSEAAAEAALLSFAAAACLPARERARALGETSTLERIQSATAYFREAQRRLAAEVALRTLAETDMGDETAKGDEPA
jgi:hypothetical protein